MSINLGLVRPDRRGVIAWAWASIIANSVLVLTGGLVRLTASGLGCPTWPKCTEESFVPHGALGIHGVIEFGNRLLTYVLVAVAIGTLIAVWRWADGDRFARILSVVLALGIPFQGVIGGITVLTDLNPWVVSLHMILTMLLISGSVWLLVHVSGRNPAQTPGAVLIWLTYAALWATIYIGTIVTGSGPHAGDPDSPRNGLDPRTWSQIHADVVFLLIGLTIGFLVLVKVVRPELSRATEAFLLVQLAQGAIGFVQYFTDLPIVLVAAHLTGAAVLVASGTYLLLRTTHARPSTR